MTLSWTSDTASRAKPSLPLAEAMEATPLGSEANPSTDTAIVP
jgi:hypothetical protein